MIRRLLILFTLAGLVALPFLLRPKQRPSENADDVVVVITSHNEAIRQEFGRGFARWYQSRTGRTVTVDWRVIGGTSEITRFLEAGYVAAFRRHWTDVLQRPWSAEVQRALVDPSVAAAESGRAVRAAFVDSDVGCGLDVFWGGASYDFARQANAGRLVAARVTQEHPEWFTDAVLPQEHAGEPYRDLEGRWIGTVLSSYGILYNRDSLRRLGIERPPEEWADLADPRFAGEVALADPTKSSSIAKAFEYIVQQQMQRREIELGGEGDRSQYREANGAATPSSRSSVRAAEEDATGSSGPQPRQPAAAIEQEAVSEGWLAGLRLLQQIGANARYFTDSSQKPPIDVGQGDCAAGICIDFYGWAQMEATGQRGAGEPRLGFVSPRGGAVHAVDPIGLLRGAPHRDVAEAFIEFTLTMDGQKLWNLRPGTPGGPTHFALRRLPVRRDFYAHEEWKPLRSDPDANPYATEEQLIYRRERTAPLIRELAFIARVMMQDAHPELVRAWRAIQHAPELRRSRALAQLQELSPVSYERAQGEIRRALRSSNRIEELRVARELGEFFRHSYTEAERIARGE
ncbi:ABC transporter substrate-binding protein [Opitutus terrae]|uniref:ABC-type Fe3+ transport system periplasmic component-like protein n=1 Tax=Opitutus terrae (strain DSM 11246 / JCM 15787 / PB90-1) TaxID=452637 RepID=B1ZWE0_OPITP|nr:extracellular solute-binding protein [Opitutus terrae]ACB76892.1 ABC-type Fe3+ transport system periplasmic component-like protein [Opitutus terrae PB90-1]